MASVFDTDFQHRSIGVEDPLTIDQNGSFLNVQSLGRSIGGTGSSIRAADGFMGLPTSGNSNQYEKNQRNYFDHKSLIFAALILGVGGIVLLCKTWWKISFDLPCYPNITLYVAMVLFSMLIIATGILVATWGLLRLMKGKLLYGK